MSQDIYPIGQHRCYSCLQWDGVRTYDHEKAKIKVDASSLGNCRISHNRIKGTAFCENYYALR